MNKNTDNACCGMAPNFIKFSRMKFTWNLIIPKLHCIKLSYVQVGRKGSADFWDHLTLLICSFMFFSPHLGTMGSCGTNQLSMPYSSTGQQYLLQQVYISQMMACFFLQYVLESKPLPLPTHVRKFIRILPRTWLHFKDRKGRKSPRNLVLSSAL